MHLCSPLVSLYVSLSHGAVWMHEVVRDPVKATVVDVQLFAGRVTHRDHQRLDFLRMLLEHDVVAAIATATVVDVPRQHVV